MRIRLRVSKIRKTSWTDYGIRFLFGGAVTVLTGFFAKEYGPVFGGLFLAFPAIFPASSTLIEKHQRRAGCGNSEYAPGPAVIGARRAGRGVGQYRADGFWCVRMEVFASMECRGDFACGTRDMVYLVGRILAIRRTSTCNTPMEKQPRGELR